MLSAGSVVSLDDLAALLTLANALAVLGSWNSCMKNPWGWHSPTGTDLG
jgi:hypothetical protein